MKSLKISMMFLIFISFFGALVEAYPEATQPIPLSLDFYYRLGVKRSASFDEIKAAYRALAVKYHPEKNIGASAETKALYDRYLLNINEAYEYFKKQEKIRKDPSLGTPADPAEARSEPVRPQPTPRASSEDNAKKAFEALSDFYLKKTPADWDQESDYELQLLRTVFNQVATAKYSFEGLVKIKGIREIFDIAFDRPQWADSQNGLFEGFINSYGFYTLKHNTVRMSRLFASAPKNDRTLRKMILNYDFPAMSFDFQTREKRRDFMLPIMIGMLKTPQYRKTREADELLRQLARELSSVKYDTKRNLVTTTHWVAHLVTLLDDDDYRENRTLGTMMRDIPDLLKRKRIGADYVHETEFIKTYIEKYPKVFHPYGQRDPNFCGWIFW